MRIKSIIFVQSGEMMDINDLQKFLEQVVEEDPALQESLELFEVSENYYRYALDALNPSIEFVNNTSNPGDQDNVNMD